MSLLSVNSSRGTAKRQRAKAVEVSLLSVNIHTAVLLTKVELKSSLIYSFSLAFLLFL